MTYKQSYIQLMCTDRLISNSNTVKPAYSRTTRDRIFLSVAGRFRFKQVLEDWILGTPDHLGCKSVPLKTGFHCTQILFKTGFALYVSAFGKSNNTLGKHHSECSYTASHLLCLYYADTSGGSSFQVHFGQTANSTLPSSGIKSV